MLLELSKKIQKENKSSALVASARTSFCIFFSLLAMFLSFYQGIKVSTAHSGLLLKRNISWPQLDPATLEAAEASPHDDGGDPVIFQISLSKYHEADSPIAQGLLQKRQRSLRRPLSSHMTFGEFAIAPPYS